MELVLIIAVVVLVVQVMRLRNRVAQIEARLAGTVPNAATAPGAFAGAVAGADAGAVPPLPLPQVQVQDPPADSGIGSGQGGLRPQDLTQAGPWVGAGTAAPPPLPPLDGGTPDDQDRPLVIRADRFAQLARWLVANWVYVVSAVSLAFAGVFMVQYGMEKGLLPPAARVGAALAMGAALIGAGEYIRRRWGDGARTSTAYLPSTFSGAGIVTLFAGVFAGRVLYGLIGPEVAFAGFVAVAALALVLGWFHGPFLAAVGLIGAAATPFLVGGGIETPLWLPFYQVLVAAVGLGVDAARRWAWVSVLALGLGYGGLALTGMAGGDATALALAASLLALLAVAVPVRALWPAHDGPALAEALRTRGKGGWPAFPVRLAAGAIAATTLGLVLTDGAGMTGFACLALLVVGLAAWGWRAAALADLAAIPALGFLARLVIEAQQGRGLWADFQAAATVLRAPETQGPATVGLLVALAAAGTLTAALRSLRGADHRDGWAALAALFAPLAVVGLELFWHPAAVIGAYPWALHGIALAAAMAFLAERFARADRQAGRRTAYAVLACLSLIAFALFVVLTKGALTVALGVLVVVAAALDRRLRLPEMGWFIQAAMLVMGWRIVIDPGLIWAVDGAAVWEVALSFAAAVVGPLLALRLLDGIARPGARVALESGLVGAVALGVNVGLTRWLDAGAGDRLATHWAMSLQAMPWLITMLAQLYRLKASQRWLRLVRWALAAIAGLLGFAAMALAVVVMNPALGFMGSSPRYWVQGPLIFDTLLVAYGLPGAILLAGPWFLAAVPRWLRVLLQALGVALLALWILLEIRRFWHGPDLSAPFVTQPELYSYTVALLLTGAGLLYQAIARRSVLLRRAGMAVIALTAAKVFLIDASGLTGLTRVVSFLGLGLSLAGLAWLNRWAAERQGAGDDPA